MADESLVGITDLTSGEKDPRNLMLIFSMVRVMMLEWDISNHAQTLFDSVYAYFPITFRPPPNDPYGITAQDLKDRLRDCISSTKYLAPYAIPNLLDKLDSTSPVVKVRHYTLFKFFTEHHHRRMFLEL
jgi:DNA repair/transcription protein MET18/MMS19